MGQFSVGNSIALEFLSETFPPEIKIELGFIKKKKEIYVR